VPKIFFYSILIWEKLRRWARGKTAALPFGFVQQFQRINAAETYGEIYEGKRTRRCG